MRVARRDRVRAELARRRIQTGVHYPVPVTSNSPLRRFADGPLPVAERAAGELLSLPMFPHLTDGQVDFVCEALCDALRTKTASFGSDQCPMNPRVSRTRLPWWPTQACSSAIPCHGPARARSVLGAGARLRSGTVIYDGTHDRDGAWTTGHGVVIREGCEIGDDVSVWSNSVIDYGCRIGDRVKIHCNCYVAQYTELEDDVFSRPE